MTPTTNQPQSELSPFGKLGSTSAFLPIPVGNGTVQLARRPGREVEYLEPPVGQGFKGLRWERDSITGSGAYTLRAETADLAGAVPLARWRAGLANDFPNRTLAGCRPAGARRLAELARALL